jgi:hypothetical protein
MQRSIRTTVTDAAPGASGRQPARVATALVALVLVIAQFVLVLHSLSHLIAEPDEQHHCPACKLADHSPALPANAITFVAEVTPIVETSTRTFLLVPALPFPFQPRGPPAFRS